jgi:hypothetical protein
LLSSVTAAGVGLQLETLKKEAINQVPCHDIGASSI